MPTPPTAPGPGARPGRRAHAAAAVTTSRPQPPPPPAPSPPPASAPRRTARRRGLRRPRTVRARIIALLMVPVVSLLALWGFATVTTAQDVARLRELRRVDELIREPVATAITSLQAERRAAVRQVAAAGAAPSAPASAPASVSADELRQQARRTDAAVAELLLGKGHTVADGGGLPADVSDRIRRFTDRAQRLPALRAAVLAGDAPWDSVYATYTDTIATGLEVSGALTTAGDSGDRPHARVLLELSHAGEMLAREDALLTSAHLTGSLPAPRLRQFTGAVEARRILLRTAASDLPGTSPAGAGSDPWTTLSTQEPYRKVTAAEDKVAAAPAGRRAATAVPAAAWDPHHAAVRDALADLEATARDGADDGADPLTSGVLTPAGAAVLLGLAAVAASLVISVRTGRALVVELVALRNSALEIARHRLPHAMRRLRAGEELDVHAEAPQGPPAHDEIGHVAEALGTVHRAALSAAAERAELSRGISGVFVNLARRSQVLVHRQLHLLDSMERRVDDPAELDDLFRLDHLTTRMRRHAESLIILSGQAPGRAWRTAVPLTSVVRAAVSEIEDYARVEVRHLPEAAVVGTAVADLTHLLAELVENAAQFSPPHTKVRVTGEPVGNGYALEIEDRGLGMGKDALERANRRIEHSEALDLFDSDRLGLFVVRRLSARHEIRVHLRTSPYGGTTAVVLLPTALLQSAHPAAPRGNTVPPAPGARPAPGRAASTPPSGHPANAPANRPVRPSLHTPTTRTSPPAPRPTPTSPPTPASAPPTAARPSRTPEPPPTAVRNLHPRPASPPPPSAPDPLGSGTAPAGLPRRMRQTHLAPQLREAPAGHPRSASPSLAPHGADDDPEPGSAKAPGRTPEQVRARMTAYRDGWTRGTRGPAPAPTAEPRPRPRTREGDHR
ncbi:nitrate- and nitrite sensing domain-containing protein [Streptomyces sp. NPDC015131]|uniref:sensor histidine kinase n=1 Tax=Streptomyces sp. NPDC015131 TaxID=3364941 RepID=UPI0036FADBE5